MGGNVAEMTGDVGRGEIETRSAGSGKCTKDVSSPAAVPGQSGYGNEF